MKRLALLLAVLLAVLPAGCGLPRRSGAATGNAVIVTQYPASTAPVDFTGEDALAYFAEIAFGSEYGGAQGTIRKWAVPIRAAVHGGPTRQDLDALQRVMDGLNAVAGFPGITIAQADQNMDIRFVPLDAMDRAVSGYVAGNWGFFSVRTGNEGIEYAAVAIATDVTDQRARNHLLFEELIQSTGLMQDSDRYADSIFYGRWTTVQQPAPLDWELVRMLYLPAVTHDMAMDEALGALETIYAPGSAR